MVTAMMLTMSMTSVAFTAQEPLSEVPRTRLERLSTGANICRWFRWAADRPEEHFAEYISDEEMRVMRAIGLRHVRLCIHPEMIYNPERPTEPIAPMMAHIDRAIERFHRADLAVVLDLHNENQERLENDPVWREGFVQFWGALAKHYSTVNPEMLILEIINEPVFTGREGEWHALQERIVEVIRKHAPRHTIVVTGAGWGGIDGLERLPPLKDRNLVYSFHFYEPFPFTHQGATWSSPEVRVIRDIPYPSSPEAVAHLLSAIPDEGARAMVAFYGQQRWDRARMSARLNEAIEWGRRHRVPLYCGEFGVFPLVAPPESRAAWFTDFGSLLRESGVGWAIWGWDEGFGFGRRVVDGRVEFDTHVARSLGLREAP